MVYAKGGGGSRAEGGICLSFFECSCGVLTRTCNRRFRGPTMVVGREVKVGRRRLRPLGDESREVNRTRSYWE